MGPEPAGAETAGAGSAMSSEGSASGMHFGQEGAENVRSSIELGGRRQIAFTDGG